MSDHQQILVKIKLLLNLVNSPNANESAAAQAMVDRLVAKYNITEEELKSIEEKPPLYGDENKLFQTTGLISWMQQLAVAVGKFFYCQIVQEECVPSQGPHEFIYYVYGEPEDEANVKFAFKAFTKEIEQLILKNCIGRGPIYVSSYGEGACETIRNNIYWEGINIPEVKKPVKSAAEDKPAEPGTTSISVHKEEKEKEKPVDQTVDVSSQSLIKDIRAYFKGLDDAKGIFLSKVLELEAENERAQENQTGQEEGG